MARTVPEWQGATPNTQVPTRVKVRIFERASGRCATCTRKVGCGIERFAFDHITALCNGGTHSELNLQILCEECHKQKSRADIAEKAKAYLRRSKHLGIRKAKQPIRGWKLFNGTAKRNPRLRPYQ